MNVYSMSNLYGLYRTEIVNISVAFAAENIYNTLSSKSLALNFSLGHFLSLY